MFPCGHYTYDREPCRCVIFVMELSGKIERGFSCSVCSNKYSYPKILPCFHTFCEKCVEACVVQKNDGKQPDLRCSIECPVCGSESLAPNSNVSANDWVRSLPRNLLLESLMNAKNGDGKCTPCSRAMEDKEARYQCLSCRENLCEVCYSYMHQRIEGYKEHSVSKFGEAEVNLDVNNDCVLHPSEILQEYCVPHQLLCCRVCVASEHRACSEFIPVDKIAETKGTDIVPKDVLSKLLDIKEKADSCLAPLNEEMEGYEMKHADFRNTVMSTAEQMKKKLREIQNVFNNQLQEIQINESKRLASAKKHLEAFLNTLTGAEKLLTIVAMRGTRRQMFITSSRVKLQIRRQFERLEEQYGKQYEFDCQLNCDVEKLREIEYIAHMNESKTDLTAVSELEDELTSFEESLEFDDLTSEAVVDPLKLKAIQIANYSPEIFRFRDGALLLDGTVLLLVGNGLQGLHDGEVSVLFELEETDPFSFRGMCLDDDEKRLFVTTDNNKIIEFTIQGKNVQRIRDINTIVDCSAIRYSSGKFYCRLSNKDYGIAILNEEGKPLRYLSGPDSSSFDIALSKNGQRIYFSRKTTMSCLYDGGKTVFYRENLITGYSHKDYRGLDVDQYGNAYVCERIEGKIVQISNNGQTVRTFLEPGPRPEIIRFDIERQKFCVIRLPSQSYFVDFCVQIFELCIADENEEEIENNAE